MLALPADGDIAASIRRLLPDARAAWLFGSAARNAIRPDSDIDIAVLHDARLEAAARFDLAAALADEWGRDVDFLDVLRLPTAMQLQVLQSGRLLFAQDPTRVLNLQAMVVREYQDMQVWRAPMIQALTARLRGMPA